MDNSLTPEEWEFVKAIKEALNDPFFQCSKGAANRLLDAIDRLSAENAALTAANSTLESDKYNAEMNLSLLTEQVAAEKRRADAAIADLARMSDLAGLCFGCKCDGGEEDGCQHPEQHKRCEEYHHYTWRGVPAAPDGAEGEG
jgi:hypothetical protein